MSVYTSNNWLVNGSSLYPSDPRSSGSLPLHLEVNKRETQMEIKQNGHSHMEDLHSRDLPHFTREPSPAYNRNLCDTKEDFQERGYYPPSEPARRHRYNNFIGPPLPPHQEISYPEKRGILHGTRHPYRNTLPRPHSARSWTSNYRERRPFHFHNYRPFPRARNSGILPYPQGFNTPDYSGYQHNDSHRYVHDQGQNSCGERYHYQDLRDPRVNRQKSIDPQPNLPESVKNQSSDFLLQRQLDQIRKEHSYCLTSSPKETNESESKIKSSNSSGQFLLTPVPKSSSVSIPIQKQPVKVQFLTQTGFWPVTDSFSYGDFSMDLDYDSGLDEVASEDESDRKVPYVDNCVVVIEADKPKHLIPNCTQIEKNQAHDESEEFFEATTKQAENTQVLLKESSGSTEDSNVVYQSVSQLNKLQQRKSKRLSRKRLAREVKTEFLTQLQETLSVDNKLIVSEEKKAETSATLKNPISNELKSLLSGNFPPEILSSRSRAESQTLVRRQVMEKEIEKHERERIQTALKETDTDDSGVVTDGLCLSSTTFTNDTTSELSVSMSSSSTLTATSSGAVDMSLGQSSLSNDMESRSHDLDSSLHDLESLSTISSDISDFSPELVSRCKKISYDRSSGDTPLHKACRKGKLDMVRCLLFYLKTDPNVADNAGWTPLHEACGNNRFVIANLLLRSGADANASATDGTRPIHDAVEVGAVDIVKTLVEHGADPTTELGEKSPLDLARENCYPEIYGYLKPIVEEYLARRNTPAVSVTAPATTISNQKVISHCEKMPNDDDDDIEALPVSGYTKDDPSFGQELDFPLFYICPILELSETPMLPVYNFEIVSGSNPRKHNFYLLPELLKALNMNEAQLRQHCSEIAALELTAADFLSSIQQSDYVRPPAIINTVSKTTKLKFLPVCSQLQQLLNIQRVDLDD